MIDSETALSRPVFLNIKQMQGILGIGRNRVLKLCQERPHGFPVVRVGNRYQSELSRLRAWMDDWYAGKFTID